MDHHSLRNSRSRRLELEPQNNGRTCSRAIGCFDLLDTLGRGNFATVKRAVHVFSGEQVAIKVIDQTKLDDHGKNQLLQEVRIMKLLHHPNIVRLYEIIDTPSTMYLVLELAEEGDLYDYMLKNEKAMSEKTARHYFEQIVNAVDYCHQLHVVHRDLKPENVLMFRKLRMVKLTDFGFGHLCQPGTSLEVSCGSMRYSSPEILFGKKYDGPAVDIWGLGILLYAMLCGRPPFVERTDPETVSAILDCRYTFPKGLSAQSSSLVGRMLVKKPEERASIPEIRQHPWLAQESSAHEAMPCVLRRNSEENGEESVVPVCRALVTHRSVSEESHDYIVKTMIDGGLANYVEEITRALEADEYNDVTATYWLLAERLLRAQNDDWRVGNGTEEEDELISVNFAANELEDTTSRSHRLNYQRRKPVDLASVAEMLEELSEDEEETSSTVETRVAPNAKSSTPSARFSPSSSRRLTSAKSSPHLLQLNKISEEGNGQELDVFSEAFSSVSRDKSLAHRERQITSPDRLKRIERSRRRQRSRSGSGSSQNSSDCSDTDDVSIGSLSKASPSRVSFMRHHQRAFQQRRCVSMSFASTSTGSRSYQRDSASPAPRNASAPTLFPAPIEDKLDLKADGAKRDKVLQHSQSLTAISSHKMTGTLLEREPRQRSVPHRPQSLPPVGHHSVDYLLEEQMHRSSALGGRSSTSPSTSRLAIRQNC